MSLETYSAINKKSTKKYSTHAGGGMSKDDSSQLKEISMAKARTMGATK